MRIGTLAAFANLMFVGAALTLTAEPLPVIEGLTLSGKNIVLPEATKGHLAVIIIGFTKGSQANTKVWGARMQQETALTTYSIAVLEDVPGLLRGMVSRNIKRDIKPELHDRFLLVYRNEVELKKAAGFDRPDDAYVLLVDGSGNIRWRSHAQPTEAVMANLKALAK